MFHWERTGVKDWKKSAVVVGVAGLILGAGALVWAGIGAALGGIDTRRLGVPKEDMRAIGDSLDQGKAALAVLCDDYEVAPLSAELTRLGGTITDYTVPQDVVAQTEQGTSPKRRWRPVRSRKRALMLWNSCPQRSRHLPVGRPCQPLHKTSRCR